MARTVKKINSVSSYGDMVTHTPLEYYDQTPGNYDINNYYLRELQDKVDAEWNYRPNRILVEYETRKASDKWMPIEVVLQGVKNEKGKPISEDYVDLVFRDIGESRFNVGDKFRFSRTYKIDTANKKKDVWLVTNRNTFSMTSSVVVQRCNGTLGSLWIDEQGVAHKHYEPVILSGELNSVNLFYNSVADSPQAHLVITAQHNCFTGQYKMNQRFILGPRMKDASGKLVSQVYRLKTIDRFYGLSTDNPENVGLVKMYMEITELSEYDDFESRIAYQEDDTLQFVNTNENYAIAFDEPSYIDTILKSSEVTFKPVVTDSMGNRYSNLNQYIETSCVLENLPEIVNPATYIEFVEHAATNDEQYYFTLRRKRVYLNGDLVVTCAVPAEHSPTGEALSTSFRLVVREQEV